MNEHIYRTEKGEKSVVMFELDKSAKIILAYKKLQSFLNNHDELTDMAIAELDFILSLLEDGE